MGSLGIGLVDLTTPAPEIDDSGTDVRRQIYETRQSLLKLLRTLDQAADSPWQEDTPSDRAGGS